ncbi:hypothetical protein LTS18_006760, partial [Coniosporium uncinatum]
FLRFKPKGRDNAILIGEPVDPSVDVGAATINGDDVEVNIYSGSSILEPGQKTDRKETIGTLLSPVSREEAGTIRCIGLNYKQHAEEVGMQIPSEPTVFLKPAESLADPWPAPTIIPKFTIKDNCADYESELAVIIGKTCKDVSESDAMDYVLGYTACNDVSSRKSQLSQSQWSFSKGFDGACPIGPVLVTRDSVKDPKEFKVTGKKNGKVMQQCGCDDLIFGIPKLVSFVSSGTTLKPGTVIITGTPAGVGISCKPPEWVQNGDVFSVEITPYIGTLATKYINEE